MHAREIGHVLRSRGKIAQIGIASNIGRLSYEDFRLCGPSAHPFT